MSHGNVELVRTLLSAFDRADYDAALEALDPEIEWQVPPGISIGREVFRGRDEVYRGFAEWLAAWDTHRFEPEEVLDHGDHVLVGGTLPPLDRQHSDRECHPSVRSGRASVAQRGANR
jgi:ketosteroid isomerase-like protein